MWKWLLFLNGLILSTMMPALAAMEPAATVWKSTGAGLLDNLDTEEFEVLEDVHVEVAPVS